MGPRNLLRRCMLLRQQALREVEPLLELHDADLEAVELRQTVLQLLEPGLRDIVRPATPPHDRAVDGKQQHRSAGPEKEYALLVNARLGHEEADGADRECRMDREAHGIDAEPPLETHVPPPCSRAASLRPCARSRSAKSRRSSSSAKRACSPSISRTRMRRSSSSRRSSGSSVRPSMRREIARTSGQSTMTAPEIMARTIRTKIGGGSVCHHSGPPKPWTTTGNSDMSGIVGGGTGGGGVCGPCSITSSHFPPAAAPAPWRESALRNQRAPRAP